MNVMNGRATHRSTTPTATMHVSLDVNECFFIHLDLHIHCDIQNGNIKILANSQNMLQGRCLKENSFHV